MKENSSSTLEDAVLYDSVMKVLYNGYPNNGSSIQQKYQLTDDQFRGITQLVIWKFTDSYTGYSFSSDNLENAYNELSNVSQLTYPSNFKLNLYLSTNPYVQNFLAAEMLPENQTEYTSVSVNKVWDDVNNQDGQRSSEVTVQLLANGVEVSDQQLVLSDANGWNGTFENLDKYDSDNVLIDYTVKEVTDLSGYQSVVSGSDNNYTITNTHVPEIINLSGTKTWDDNNNQDGIRPDSSTVNLLANGTKVASQEVTADTNWTYTFLNLAKYANGSAITYAVTEDSVDNYTATINGYDITNNYTPDKTSLTVTKVWDDSDDQDGFVLILLMSNYMLMAKNLVML